MARTCAVTGKKAQYGNNVSHANNRTRRRFNTNLQECSFPSAILGTRIRLRLTAHGVRTVEHRGGIDAYLLETRASTLTDEGKRLRKRLQVAKAKQDGVKGGKAA